MDESLITWLLSIISESKHHLGIIQPKFLIQTQRIFVMILMWQVSIFYKMKNLNHVMSFYMRVETDWDGIWYDEDRSLPTLLWHRHRLMGWSKVSKPACVHFLTTSLCIPFEFIACVYIWYVFVYVCVFMCMCADIWLWFFYVRILVSGAGIHCSSWI